MAENLGLLCPENTNTCFGDFDCNATLGFGVSPSWHKQEDQNHYQEPIFNNDCSKSLMGFSPNGEDRFRAMVEREINHLPKDDYLKRLRSGDLDLSNRREALEWIVKAQTHYSFGPLSVCLSMNYFDRFLSVYQLPKGKAWTVQLLAVACLSLAAKMEETNVPLSVDLQVGEPKFVFEAKTIQRMELLVLSTLNWRMQAITPYCYIDYFLSKMNGNKNVPTSLINRTLQLILSMIKGIDFLEFRPSEIAAAVTIFVSGENQAVHIDKAMPAFIHIEKDRVMKIIELIKDLALNSGGGSGSYVPRSPNGVLEAACLSYKTDELTVGSCANSSSHNNNSPDIKRRKPANQPTQVENKS